MNAPHQPEDMTTKLWRVFNPCNVGGCVSVGICAYFAWKTVGLFRLSSAYSAQRHLLAKKNQISFFLQGNWQDFAAISAISGLVAGAGSCVVEMFVKNRASFSRVPVAVSKLILASERRLEKKIDDAKSDVLEAIKALKED